MKLLRYADQPDLRAIRYEVLSQQTFPEYLQHNVPGKKYWGRLYDDFPDFQLALLDGDELVAELHSVPTPWVGWRRGCWTRCAAPPKQVGDYVVPEMLAPLYVRDGRGRHVQPNVWLRHRLQRQ